MIVPIEFIRNMLILFSLEKQLSYSIAIIDMVTVIFNMVTHTEKVCNILSDEKYNKAVAHKAYTIFGKCMSLQYFKFSSLLLTIYYGIKFSKSFFGVHSTVRTFQAKTISEHINVLKTETFY